MQNEYAIVKLPESVQMDFTTDKAKAEYYWAGIENPAERASFLEAAYFTLSEKYTRHYIAHFSEMVAGEWALGETVTLKVDACPADGCMDWVAGTHQVVVEYLGDYNQCEKVFRETSPVVEAWQLSMYL